MHADQGNPTEGNETNNGIMRVIAETFYVEIAASWSFEPAVECSL